MTSTTLALNGEGIVLKNMRVTISMSYQDQDQSGQTSSTAHAEQGIKAKELRISGMIPFSQPDILKRIFELGSARDAAGKLQVYRVAHIVARSTNFREGTFTGNIDAPPQDGKLAWLVTFTLREKLSVDEKKQARAAGKIQAGKQTGAAAGKGGSGAAAAEDDEKMSWFEAKVLKPVNEALG